jgi:hypothetical protein
MRLRGCIAKHLFLCALLTFAFVPTIYGQTCAVGLPTATASFAASGGNGTFSVTAAPDCTWTVASFSSSVAITSAATGSGNGTVAYSVAPNNSASTMNGAILINQTFFLITQSGLPCLYSLSTGSASIGAQGGSATVGIVAPPGCVWTVKTDVTWIELSWFATGTGNGSVTYTVLPNNGTGSRTGTLSIGGQLLTITQLSSCSYSLSAPSASVGPGTGAGSINVTAPSNCAWTAATDSPGWLTITAGFSGSGNGTIGFSATANPALTARSGNLIIAGITVPVTQAGAAFNPIRVHCGGTQVTDAQRNVWTPDNGPNFSVSVSPIANTATPALYQSETWSTGTLQYSYQVPNGSYTVNLKFAEIYFDRPGKRVFNIVINGNTVRSGFDILAITNPNTAYDLPTAVNVTNGQITIQLIPVVGSPKISAIEIF